MIVYAVLVETVNRKEHDGVSDIPSKDIEHVFSTYDDAKKFIDKMLESYPEENRYIGDIGFRFMYDQNDGRLMSVTKTFSIKETELD